MWMIVNNKENNSLKEILFLAKRFCFISRRIHVYQLTTSISNIGFIFLEKYNDNCYFYLSSTYVNIPIVILNHRYLNKYERIRSYIITRKSKKGNLIMRLTHNFIINLGLLLVIKVQMKEIDK